MAYTTVDKASDFFNTVLYTGNASGNHGITGVNFTPDFLWIKPRSGTDAHRIHSPLFTGTDYFIKANDTTAESQNAGCVSSFDADGFTLNNADSGWNANGTTYASWSWKAGTTSGLSGGTITPSAYSINTTSKVGTYKYTGNGYGSQTIAHGLGATPTLVMFKQLTGTEQWRVHFMEAPNPYTKMLLLNSNAAESSQSNGLSAVSSTTITFGSDGAYNLNGETYICYVFCDVQGFAQHGKFTGTADAYGPFVNTGFAPAWVMIKSVSSTNWSMYDNKRFGVNGKDAPLFADLTNSESTDYNRIHFLSNGFRIVSTSAQVNNDNTAMMYMAFAAAPLVGSNNIPANAR